MPGRAFGAFTSTVYDNIEHFIDRVVAFEINHMNG